MEVPEGWKAISNKQAEEIMIFAKNSPQMSLEDRCQGLLNLIQEGYWSSDLDLFYFKMVCEELNNMKK